MSVDSILIVCSLLKGNQAKQKSGKKSGKSCDKDNIQRMQICLKILTNAKGLKQLSEV